MKQLKKRATVSDGYFSDRECIGFLCIFELLITYLPCFFWLGMILDADRIEKITTLDLDLMYIMLTFSVAMVLSASIGFIGVLTKRFDVCRIFVITDIVHYLYFNVTTIGLIILSTFVLIKGEDKMNNYRWTKLINENIGERIIPFSIVGSVLFIFMTVLSIMCHGMIRRWTKYTKSLIPSKQESTNYGCLSDRANIAILCIIKLGIAFGLFWFGVIMMPGGDNWKPIMTKFDEYLMYIMLTVHAAMMISAIVGFIAVCGRYVVACRIFSLWDIVQCVYFSVATIGFIMLSVILLVYGDSKMNNYRWIKLMSLMTGDLSLITCSIIASVFFWFMTLLSIMCHEKIRRLVKHLKEMLHAKKWQDIESCDRFGLNKAGRPNKEVFVIGDVDDVSLSEDWGVHAMSEGLANIYAKKTEIKEKPYSRAQFLVDKTVGKANEESKWNEDDLSGDKENPLVDIHEKLDSQIFGRAHRMTKRRRRKVRTSLVSYNSNCDAPSNLKSDEAEVIKEANKEESDEENKEESGKKGKEWFRKMVLKWNGRPR